MSEFRKLLYVLAMKYSRNIIRLSAFGFRFTETKWNKEFVTFQK